MSMRGAGIFAGSLALAAGAADAQLTYRATLPQFGGFNGQALSVLQFEKQLEDQKIARIRAAQSAADREASGAFSPSRRLTDAIVNYMNAEIARRFANEILSGSAPEGVVAIGDVTIGFVRDNGTLTVTIADPSGSTEVKVPVLP